MNEPVLGIIGDIGATNARFSLLHPDGTMTEPRVFSSADYTDIADAILSFLTSGSQSGRPTVGVLAVAAAVAGDSVTMTNHELR